MRVGDEKQKMRTKRKAAAGPGGQHALLTDATHFDKKHLMCYMAGRGDDQGQQRAESDTVGKEDRLPQKQLPADRDPLPRRKSWGPEALTPGQIRLAKSIPEKDTELKFPLSFLQGL